MPADHHGVGVQDQGVGFSSIVNTIRGDFIVCCLEVHLQLSGRCFANPELQIKYCAWPLVECCIRIGFVSSDKRPEILDESEQGMPT